MRTWLSATTEAPLTRSASRFLKPAPRGLLCDEITSALDPELKSEVLTVLESLKREGLTLILVTHEIGFARRAADRVVVLADGRIVEDGPPGQVIDNPRAPRNAQFFEADDDMKKKPVRKASRCRGGDMRAEYKLDYSKAKPNRFASRVGQGPASGWGPGPSNVPRSVHHAGSSE